MYSQDLIYGKDKTKNVVGLEPEDGKVTLFLELPDGSISTEVREFKNYILFADQLSEKFQRLSGNQPYKWLYEATSREKYLEVVSASYKKRHDFYIIRDPKEAYMCRHGATFFKGMKVSDVSVLSFDIETNGLALNSESRVLLISNTYRSRGTVTRKLFCEDEYASQVDMFVAWSKWVREMNPSIVLGHNIFGFDLPYMNHCGGTASMRLGRDGSPIKFADRGSQFRKDGSQSYDYTNALIYGREVIDTMFLAMKFDIGRNYESYKLKSIIAHENLEREGREHYDASKIRENWADPVEREKIKRYAIDDADDALKLFDLMIPSFFYLTQSIPRSLQAIINSATGSWINSFMVRSYLQQGHSIARASQMPEKTEGGISFAVPMVYKNLFKVDLKSAYPSQILRFRLYDADKDPEANFYKMVCYFAEERFELKRKFKETKESYYRDRDSSAKVFLNSAYGVTITRGLNYNSPPIGAKITEETRNMIDLALLYASGKNRDFWVDKFKTAKGKR